MTLHNALSVLERAERDTDPAPSLERRMLPLHSSEMLTYQRCPREWQHAYVARRVPLLRPEALTRGKAVHQWLAGAWSGVPAALPEDPIAQACCLGYAARYGRQVTDLQQVQVEVGWEGLVGGVECAGELDAIGYESDGQEVIVDHKTTSRDISPGSSYWSEIVTGNVQVSMYAAAHPGAKLMWDVIRKPALRKLRAGKPNEETDAQLVVRCLEAMAEDPARYFARVTVVRLEHEHAAFAEDVAAVDALRRGGPNPRNPSSCHSFGRLCRYHSVCYGNVSLDDDSVYGMNTHGLETSEPVYSEET